MADRIAHTLRADSPKSTSTPAPKVIGLKQDDVNYVDRSAVRIILKNDKDEVMLINISDGNYYKLPGGGIEPGEDHSFTGAREVKEETGCVVAVEDGCIATTEEWRDDLHQISHCYGASLAHDTGKTELTSPEEQEGLKHEWAPVEEAVEKMSQCEPTSKLGRFIRERDLFLLSRYAAMRKCDGANGDT